MTDSHFGVDRPKGLVGREYHWDKLKECWRKEVNCQIVGPPGVGKSRLLTAFAAYARAAHPEDEEAASPSRRGGRPSRNVLETIGASVKGFFSGRPAVLDAPQAPAEPKVAFFDLAKESCHTVRGFLDDLSEQWGIATIVSSLADCSDLVSHWHESGVRVLLCLDRFAEIVRREREFDLSFFLDLRELSHRGAVLMTTNEKPLGQLLPAYLPTSPFFDSFVTLYLPPLSETDAEAFLTAFQPPGRPFTAEERKAIRAFAQGYPLRLQVAASHVLRARDRGETLESALRSADADETLKHFPRISRGNKKSLSPTKEARPLEGTARAPSDDPQKGKWGGSPRANGRVLRASVHDPYGELFLVRLEVASEDASRPPLTGTVTFHLHPTFLNPHPTVMVSDGVAVLEIIAYGAFTVGAVADGGATRLELDLATLPDAPALFRER